MAGATASGTPAGRANARRRETRNIERQVILSVLDRKWRAPLRDGLPA